MRLWESHLLSQHLIPLCFVHFTPQWEQTNCSYSQVMEALQLYSCVTRRAPQFQQAATTNLSVLMLQRSCCGPIFLTTRLQPSKTSCNCTDNLKEPFLIQIKVHRRFFHSINFRDVRKNAGLYSFLKDLRHCLDQTQFGNMFHHQGTTQDLPT